MADWRNYVRQVAMRYKGRIQEYQIWNEPSDKSHFSGSLPKIVELTCEAFKILKSIDPGVRVVSPGSAGGGHHIKYLEEFLAGGGNRCIDVVAHHLYVPRFGPEAMIPIIREVRSVMRRTGVAQLPLWNTETGWWISNTEGGPEPDAVAKGGWRKVDAGIEGRGVLQRAFLLARAEGVDRFYWYAWANQYGWGLADSSGRGKPLTDGWNTILDAMIGKTIERCVVEDKYKNICELRDANRKESTLSWIDSTALVRREGGAEVKASEYSIPLH
jgi:hypothetical protein